MKIFPLIIFLLFQIVVCWEAEYPDHIPVFEVRLDRYTKKPVSRGRMELIGGFYDGTPRKKISLNEMKKALQCAPVQRAMNGARGSLSLLKYMPPTAESFENAAAWFEGTCGANWNDCHIEALKCKASNGNCKRGDNKIDGFVDTRLFRVINGLLYRDFPWDAQRFANNKVKSVLFDVILNFNIPEVAFYMANEQHSSPVNFAIPIFSAAPSIDSSDMPWPWPVHYNLEKKLHINAVKENISFNSSEYYASYAENKTWSERISKVAFFGTLSSNRAMFGYVAAKRHDVLQATVEMTPTLMNAINPLSQEETLEYNNIDKDWSKFEDNNVTNKYTEFGFIRNLVHLPHKFEKYKPSDYKYHAVLLGLDGSSTADRLGALLAYSGSVIMIQNSRFEYHFSHKLKPWVHYVPVSYNIADIAEKVDWLIAHDKEAQQIAANGRAFGLSYLRVEDELCYMAQALEVISKLEEGSDVLKPFNSILMTESQRDVD